jgi:hypothetical protein
VGVGEIKDNTTSDSMLEPPLQGQLCFILANALLLATILAVMEAWQWMKNGKGKILQEWFVKGPEDSKEPNGSKELISGRPSYSQVAVSAFMIGWVAWRCRNWPVIIDDPVQCYSRLNPKNRPQTATAFMEKIRGWGHNRPVVILSSNEGITRCFYDNAPGLHVSSPFPALSTQELARVANTIARKTPESKLSLLEPDLLIKAQKVLPTHFAFSLRFWIFLDDTGALEDFCLSLNRGTISIPHDVLRQLALNLDLAEEATFRATALGQSLLMDEAEKEKLRHLVGDQELSLPHELPRRLGLTYALARSAKYNDPLFHPCLEGKEPMRLEDKQTQERRHKWKEDLSLMQTRKSASVKDVGAKKRFEDAFRDLQTHPSLGKRSPELTEHISFLQAVVAKLAVPSDENIQLQMDRLKFIQPLINEALAILILLCDP